MKTNKHWVVKLVLIAIAVMAVIFLFVKNSAPLPAYVYNNISLSKVNPQNGKLNELISFSGKDNYDDSLSFSPNNKMIAYFIGDHNVYYLYIYDINKATSTLAAPAVILDSGYIQGPVWSSDSQTVFFTQKVLGRNALYSFDLSKGELDSYDSYNGEAFWPKILDGDTLLFNTDLNFPDNSANDIGIMNITSKKISVAHFPTSMYLFNAIKLGGNIIAVGAPNLSNFGESDTSTIYGLYNVSINPISVSSYPIPAGIDMSQIKRVQPTIDCNGHIILGTVIDANNFEKYNKYYSYNIASSDIKDVSDMISSTTDVRTFKCDAYDPKEIIVGQRIDSNHGMTLDIIDDNGNAVQKQYADIIPPNIKQTDIDNQCFVPTILAEDSTSGYIYVSVASSANDFNTCSFDGDGIYAVNSKHKVFQRIGASSDLFHIAR